MLKTYPVASKQKAVDICNAFVAGAPKTAEGAVFFGVNDTNVREFNRVRAAGIDWFYLDNAYLDKWRGTFFRATKNALQCSGLGKSDGSRFARLGIEIKPWRTNPGPETLLCEQSASFMRTAAKYPGNWTADTINRLCDFGLTGGHVRVRQWSPDKIKARTTLLQDMASLRVLITHSSGSAITALLEGTPAISEAGAAHCLTGPLTAESIAYPPRPEGREEFAHVLADSQWTLDEMKEGIAWKKLNSL